MKSVLIYLILLISSLGYAQSLQVIDSNNLDISGDTVVTEINISDYDVSVNVGLQNIGASSIDVNVTRYEVDVLPETSSYFCWGTCTGVSTSGYNPEQTPAGSITFASQQTIPQSSGFEFHYDPNYNAGSSLFRIKFFDINNPNDSVDVYFLFKSLDQLIVTENETDQISIYPNPSSDFIYIDNPESANWNNIQLLSIDGKLVKSFNVNSKLNVSNIERGVYFLKLEGDKSHFFKKVVVN